MRTTPTLSAQSAINRRLRRAAIVIAAAGVLAAVEPAAVTAPSKDRRFPDANLRAQRRADMAAKKQAAMSKA